MQPTRWVRGALGPAIAYKELGDLDTRSCQSKAGRRHTSIYELNRGLSIHALLGNMRGPATAHAQYGGIQSLPLS